MVARRYAQDTLNAGVEKLTVMRCDVGRRSNGTSAFQSGGSIEALTRRPARSASVRSALVDVNIVCSYAIRGVRIRRYAPEYLY